MAESAKTPPSRKADPREILDAVTRAKILALLELGCSRRMAARQVDCAASTISRTAARDENFAAQLADAAGQADVRALKLICHAAQQERYWRVAAWLLERRNPDEYGRRPPHTFTAEQVAALLARGLEGVLAAVPAESAQAVEDVFDDLLEDIDVKAGRPPEQDVEEPSPPPAKTR